MFLRNRLVLIAGGLYFLLAIGHIPVDIFPHAFDKNAPVHFTTLMIISLIYGTYIFIYQNRFNIPVKVLALIWGLVLAALFSTLRSPDLIGSLTGDSGRFTGAVSLFCLLLVAIFHSQLELASIHKLVQLFVFTIFVVSILGVFQHHKLIELPGDVGVTGTLGNLDFFGAFVGTGFALFVYLFPSIPKWRRVLFSFFILMELYAVYLAGPLQAYVDIAIILIALAILYFREYFPSYELSLNKKTFFGTLATVIWLEGIFLMPFLGTFIPVLGDDPQVKIRGQFWLAATRQFTSNPLSGVGPDQYGNFYEKYRTVASVQEHPTLLANDAHGAPAQTLATLGIVGTIAFILLLALLVRSFCLLFERYPEDKFKYAAIGLYLFVFTTNAAVSPITLPHKYIFWALAGFIVGRAYINRGAAVPVKSKWMASTLIFTLLSPTIYVLVNFVPAQIDFLRANEKFVKNPNQSISIKYNNFLPCLIYYPNLARILNKQGEKELIIFTQDQISGNPNCTEAWINLAKISYNQGDLLVMKEVIYQLIKIAPSRGEVINLAALYANKAGDKALDDLVNKQLLKFNPGLVIVE